MSKNSNMIKLVVLKNDKILKQGEDFTFEGDNIILKTPLQPDERLSVRKLEEDNG